MTQGPPTAKTPTSKLNGVATAARRRTTLRTGHPMTHNRQHQTTECQHAKQRPKSVPAPLGSGAAPLRVDAIVYSW
jgi:hypothetical protein